VRIKQNDIEYYSQAADNVIVVDNSEGPGVRLKKGKS
jgi:hypothetical protein